MLAKAEGTLRYKEKEIIELKENSEILSKLNQKLESSKKDIGELSSSFDLHEEARIAKENAIFSSQKKAWANATATEEYTDELFETIIELNAYQVNEADSLISQRSKIKERIKERKTT